MVPYSIQLSRDTKFTIKKNDTSWYLLKDSKITLIAWPIHASYMLDYNSIQPALMRINITGIFHSLVSPTSGRTHVTLE